MKSSKIFNRAVSAAMCLTLALGLPVSAAEELASPSANVNVTFSGWNGETFKKAEADISAVSSEEIYLAVAGYKGEVLQDLQFGKYTPSDGKISETLTLTDFEKETDVKVFVWDKDLKPVYDGNYKRENVLYVTSEGSESPDGTENAPYSSLESAYNLAKEADCDITVSLSAGTYSVSEPICLSGSNESGSAVSVKGDENGGTVIDGGRAVSGFKAVDGKNYFVCDVESENGIYELYVNNHRAKIAQTENVFYATEISGDENGGILTFSGENALPFNISGSDDLRISTVNEWHYAISPVKSFSYENKDNQTVYLDKYNYDTYTLFQSALNPFCFMNSLEFLDSEGEFFYDKKAHKLYYYPLSGETAESITAYIPVSEGLISVENAKNVTFENLTLTHGTWNKPYMEGYQNGQAECYITDSATAAEKRASYPKTAPSWTDSWLFVNPSQVELTNCENVSFKNNKIQNIGAGGIKFKDSCQSCEAVGNIFYDIGGAAATIGEPSHNEILFGNMDKITRNISVKNNLIRKTAQILQGSCAISAYYTNSCNISHNDIAESSYSGITLGWGWCNDVSECKNNTISNNKIVNILSDLWDGNHIYTLGDMPGTVVSGNYMSRTNEKCGGGGFYPDEGSMNITVSDNVIENMRNWTFNLTDYQIKSLRTLSDGTVIYGHPEKNITYSGNYVDFLKKYRLKFNDGEYKNLVIDGETKSVCVTKPTYSGYEDTPLEKLDGFIELSDFSQDEQAQAIIANAGVESEYKYLENYIPSLNISVDNGIKKDRYFASDDYFEISAGDCDLSGGNGVSYNSTDKYNTRDGCNDYVSIGGRYKGIGLGEYGNYKGDWVTYKVTPEKSGVYNIYINAGSTGNCDFEVSLDGEVINSHAGMKATGSYSKPSYSLIACGITLEANRTYTLKLEESRGAASIISLIFDRVSDKLSKSSFNSDFAEVIATDDFANYSGVSYGYTSIRYTKLSNADLNGGKGFSTSWYGTLGDSESSVSNGYFAKTALTGGEKAVYTKTQKLYRKLESPITLTEDKVLKIEFTSRFGDSSASYSGLELLKDWAYAETSYKTGNYQQQIVALGSASKDSESYVLTPWTHNLVEIFTDGGNYETKMYTDKTLLKDTFYKYVAEIEVNGDSADTIRIKAYKEGDSEPENWDCVYKTELGADPITHIAFNCQNETYLKDLKISCFKQTLLASEDFGAYTVDGAFPVGTDLKGFSLNGGVGFDGSWYDKTSDPSLGVTGQGNFSTHIKNALYLYQKRLYNKLETPISLTERQAIRFEFVSLFQHYSNQFSGAELMNSSHNVILGSGSFTTGDEKDDTRKYYLNAWTSNSKDSRKESEKELYRQSYYYRYVAEIDINPDGLETIRIKAYDVTDSEGEEPTDWDYTFRAELGADPITHIALNCNNITYFNSLKLYKKFISE